MLPKVILHKAVSLDGRIENFEREILMEFSIPHRFEINAHFIDSKSITQFVDMIPQKAWDELLKLENLKATRVKIREGIEKDDVKCPVCHKNVDLGKDNLVVCPFCKSVYHYLCVAFWLTKHNACPTCQNQFLDPKTRRRSMRRS